jgi:primosomal protein N' (replication factor Y)
MQYADVAVAVKTVNRQQSYTYRIPPALLADISIGQRVYVPFYRRKLIGTVIDLRATAPKIRGSFKEIENLVEPVPLFDLPMLELAKAVADRYGTTIGQILEIASPKPAVRKAKKLEVPKLIRPARNTIDTKLYGLYKPVGERVDNYINLIKNAHSKKRSVLVLFPTQEHCEEFGRYLEVGGLKPVIIPPTSDLTEHYEAWLQARLTEQTVVIGTRKTIFAPVLNLGLIIVDSPSLYGYKDEQSPYYHALTVAKLRAKLAKSHLVVGDAVEQLGEWYEAQRGEMHYLPRTEQPTKITLIDTTSQRGLISELLLNYIQETLGRGGKVALYYNRKGSGRFFQCLECETAIYCPRCDTPLTVFDRDGTPLLRCAKDGYETQAPYRCPVCQSYKLGSIGMGVDTLAKRMAEHFPDKVIATLGGNADQLGEHDILISTAQFFYLPLEICYDLVAAFQLDQQLHGSEWDKNEQAYILFSHLAERAKHLIIHSAEPENLVIKALRANDSSQLYESELESRKTSGYPPITPLLKLVYAGSDELKVKQTADQLYQRYKTLLPNGERAVFPPSPIASGKMRDKYRYQIMIKSPITRIILDNLPADWQLDAEPGG